MSLIVSIDQASTQLRVLVGALGPNDEIVLTDNNMPVARITREAPTANRSGGAWKGKLEIKGDGDGAILDHFKDHMP